MDVDQKGVRAVIRRNRLQQKDVAEALGISRMTVLNWVHGNSVPTGTNLLRLLDYLRGFEPALQVEDLLPPVTASVATASVVVPESGNSSDAA